MKFKIIPLQQQSSEWKEFRRGKIGSSDAPSIMNESPWETPLQCWERHVFRLEKETTSAMTRGIELEPKARQWVNDLLRCNYQPVVIQSIEHPDLLASLDGYYCQEGKHYLLEIKCPNQKDHEIALSKKVPAHYWPQLQHQMMVAGVDSMLYASYDGNDGIAFSVPRDRDYCEKLLSSEMAFLANLINFEPPAYVDRDWIEISDSKSLEMASRLKEINDEIKSLSCEKDQIEAQLKCSLSNSRCKIGEVKVQKIDREGPVDYSKIEILKTIDLEQYRKPMTTYWRFIF